MVKGIVTLILFFLFALGIAGTGYVDAAETVSTEVCHEDCILPLDTDKGVADMEFGDAHRLAHRVSASAERLYRFSSIENTQFIRTLLRKMATRMASLAQCHTRVYDSSHGLNRDDACEHYIFGMRRILI